MRAWRQAEAEPREHALSARTARRPAAGGHRLRLAALLLLALAAASAPPARACGKCVEDKVAATWDAGVRTRAARVGHVVVAVEVLGPAAGAPPALRDFIARTLAATAGVDAGSVRVSLDPPAAAFACDPRRHPPAALLAAINPRLAPRRLSLRVLQVDGAPRTAATTVSANLSSASASAAPRARGR